MASAAGSNHEDEGEEAARDPLDELADRAIAGSLESLADEQLDEMRVSLIATLRPLVDDDDLWASLATSARTAAELTEEQRVALRPAAALPEAIRFTCVEKRARFTVLNNRIAFEWALTGFAGGCLKVDPYEARRYVRSIVHRLEQAPIRGDASATRNRTIWALRIAAPVASAAAFMAAAVGGAGLLASEIGEALGLPSDLTDLLRSIVTAACAVILARLVPEFERRHDVVEVTGTRYSPADARSALRRIVNSGELEQHLDRLAASAERSIDSADAEALSASFASAAAVALAATIDIVDSSGARFRGRASAARIEASEERFRLTVPIAGALTRLSLALSSEKARQDLAEVRKLASIAVKALHNFRGYGQGQGFGQHR